MEQTPSDHCKGYLQNQFPFRLVAGDLTSCEFISNTGANFTEPFFDDSLSRLRTEEANRHPFKSVASLNMLPAWSASLGKRLLPTALIFHVSRCGSTLLSQLLALKQEHMVLSEVPFLDAILRLPFLDRNLAGKDTSVLFDAALQLYLHSSKSFPERVFLKTDSWHLHFYDQLRELYPAVPFILLYRDPLEVLKSQQRRRGLQSVPGILNPEIFGFGDAQAGMTNLDEYMASVLQSYFQKLHSIIGLNKNDILVNYNEGTSRAMQKIAVATGLEIDLEYEQAMIERAGYHGKYPNEVFQEPKNLEDPPAFLLPVIELYEQLEEVRLRQD